MSPLSDRRRARELALQARYAHELSGNDPHAIVADVIAGQDELPAALKFAEELFRAAVTHTAQCDAFIKPKAVNWEFHRIAVLDKLILRLAICEFLFFEDIPPKVSIDEAIEIAKKFSTEKSGRFVNGILDSILTDFRVSGRLHKRGRGLSEGGRKEE